MAQGSFTAQISGWVQETKERKDAVYRGSAQRAITIMQTPKGHGGNMPVKTGFLRASLVVGLGALSAPLTKPADDQGPVTFNPGQVDLVIAGASMRDPIEARYTAVYARVAEYGGENRAANRFVGLTAQQWPQIVAAECAEAQGRASN